MVRPGLHTAANCLNEAFDAFEAALARMFPGRRLQSVLDTCHTLVAAHHDHANHHDHNECRRTP
ncbi:MAG: hypothetical protein ACRCYQ_03690 [Nocardioides sp.]